MKLATSNATTAIDKSFVIAFRNLASLYNEDLDYTDFKALRRKMFTMMSYVIPFQFKESVSNTMTIFIFF